MWYTIDSNGYSWKELMQLYEIIEKRERGLRDDLFRFTNFYSAVCYAILAFTLSGLVTLYDKGNILLALLIGPCLTLCMCFLGIHVTSRIYRRILTELSVKVKLENILGMDRSIPVNQFLGKEKVWESDATLLADRHTGKRDEHKNSKDFIESLSKLGFYKDNKTFFGLIGFFSSVLAIIILVLSFYGK